MSAALDGYLKSHGHELQQLPVVQNDNGSSYIGHEFKAVISEYLLENVTCHPATPTENVIIERWHRTLKEDLVEREEPKDFGEFKKLITQTVHYYNHERCHQSLGDVPPYEFYRGNPGVISDERKKYCKILRDKRKSINRERIKTLSIKTYS